MFSVTLWHEYFNIPSNNNPVKKITNKGTQFIVLGWDDSGQTFNSQQSALCH